MEINSVTAFVKYYKKTRAITSRVIAAVPEDAIDWAYARGKFTLGDLIRHIAAIERYVFMEVITGNQPAYTGCGRALCAGYSETVDFFNAMHQETLCILNSLTDDDLIREIKTLDGCITTVGNFLRALIVHEIHHRGAICIYLNILGIITPPVIGLTEAQVIQLSKS